MNVQTLIEQQWPYLVALLPADVDLESIAVETGALVRRRGVGSADALLRLVFGYAICGLSLRQTAAWAEVSSIAHLSNVALLKRLRKCDAWLGRLLALKLAERADPPAVRAEHPRVRLVDATSIRHPGATTTSWRVHLGYDLRRCCIDHIELTDVCGGETLTRFAFKPGELVVGDRGYANRRGLHHVVQAGALFVVRLHWHNLPFEDGFDLFEWLPTLPDASAAEMDVKIAASENNGIPSTAVRIVALRKSEAAAEEARRRVLRAASRKGRTTDPRTLVAAGYVCLVTNAPRENLSAAEVLGLYRFRWQVERAFKRMKGLLELGDLPTKDPPMARTYLYAKLLGALLLEDLTDRFLDFSPWGYRLR